MSPERIRIVSPSRAICNRWNQLTACPFSPQALRAARPRLDPRKTFGMIASQKSQSFNPRLPAQIAGALRLAGTWLF
jgi:hypothetical protein